MVRLRLPQLFQQAVHPCSGSFTSISQRDISIATEINAILIEYLCVVKTIGYNLADCHKFIIFHIFLFYYSEDKGREQKTNNL